MYIHLSAYIRFQDSERNTDIYMYYMDIYRYSGVYIYYVDEWLLKNVKHVKIEKRVALDFTI